MRARFPLISHKIRGANRVGPFELSEKRYRAAMMAAAGGARSVLKLLPARPVHAAPVDLRVSVRNRAVLHVAQDPSQPPEQVRAVLSLRLIDG